MLSDDEIVATYFWQEFHRRDDDIISGSMMSICHLTGNVTFDHLTKVVSAMFLHYKVIVFLFVMRFFLMLKFSRVLCSQSGSTLSLIRSVLSTVISSWLNFSMVSFCSLGTDGLVGKIRMALIKQH